MPKKVFVLQRLLAEGHFATREEALPHVMAGNVLIGGVRVRSLMERCGTELPILIKGQNMPYVAKGGLKLAGAIRDFKIAVSGRVCIDAGACTGGFTDCFLKHGASLVYAVEVGFGQLFGSLRQDKRVVNLEKTNISDEKLLSLSPVPRLGSVDLSYLSLRKGVPAFKTVMHGQGELLCLVKPLFEVDDSDARRTGVINPALYETVLQELIRDLNAQEHTAVFGVTPSPVTGNHGTHEFFLHVVLGEGLHAPDLTRETALVAEKVLALDPFKK